MKILQQAYRFIKYGKQVGKVHSDGAILYSGGLFGRGGKFTKRLIGADGRVLRVIERVPLHKECLYVEDSRLNPRTNMTTITRTIYCKNKSIGKDVFISKEKPGDKSYTIDPNSQVSSNYHIFRNR